MAVCAHTSTLYPPIRPCVFPQGGTVYSMGQVQGFFQAGIDYCRARRNNHRDQAKVIREASAAQWLLVDSFMACILMVLSLAAVALWCSTASCSRGCMLWQEILADNFVLFSLLVPFNRPSILVSPPLTPELRVELAEPVLEVDGVLSVRLGEIVWQEEGE